MSATTITVTVTAAGQKPGPLFDQLSRPCSKFPRVRYTPTPIYKPGNKQKRLAGSTGEALCSLVIPCARQCWSSCSPLCIRFPARVCFLGQKVQPESHWYWGLAAPPEPLSTSSFVFTRGHFRRGNAHKVGSLLQDTGHIQGTWEIFEVAWGYKQRLRTRK